LERYESHAGYIKPDLPVIFHSFRIEKKETDTRQSPPYIHWHENIELLYIIKGRARIIMDQAEVVADCGQIAVINSSHIHTVVLDEGCESLEYCCLIIDGAFLQNFGLDVEKTVFERLVDDAEMVESYRKIAEEMREKDLHYDAEVRADVVALMVLLFRRHTSFNKSVEEGASNRKLAIVKNVLRYLHKHYKEEVPLCEISEAVGFNKYYLSHLFKETVGYSMVQYLNHLRCSYARSLLRAESYTVAEIAEMCGFENPSYFSRTYKKHMGILPHEDRGEAR